MNTIPLAPPHKHAQPLNGRTVWTFFVRVSQSGVRDAQHDELFWINQKGVEVVAHTAADACNLVRDLIAPHVERPTEIETIGPKGGRTGRFIGWDSLIAARMFANGYADELEQTNLNLN